MQRIYVALFLICTAALPVCVPAQTGKGGTGSVEGRVLCEDGTPARAAMVYLHRVGPAPDEAETFHYSGVGSSGDASTDLNGNYLITSVASGTYFARVYQHGYSDDSYLVFRVADKLPPDRQRALIGSFPQVTVRSGSTAHVDLTIHRGASISGRVTFDSGGTLDAAEVNATLVSSPVLDELTKGNSSAHTRSNVQMDMSTTRADDRGVYRITGLPRGRYRISAMIRYAYRDSDRDHLAADLTVYLPDTLTQSEAKLVDVDVGDEITDVDITIPTGKLHSVSGFVTRGGVPLDDARVEILSQAEAATSRPSKSRLNVLTRVDGSFRFDVMPSGTYILRVQYSPKGTPRANAVTRQISVIIGDSDVLGANIDLPSPKQ